jgi:hypothetical protein
MYLGELIASGLKQMFQNLKHEIAEKFIAINLKCLLEDGYANILGIGVNVQINLDDSNA